MDLNDISVMSSLKKRMKWLTENQKTIARNVSNANTPGFRAQELQKQNFSNLVEKVQSTRGHASVPSVQMRMSNPKHMNAQGKAGTAYRLNEVEGNEESAGGNSVVLEREMLKLADNQMQYKMMIGLYKKNMGILKAALGKGK